MLPRTTLLATLAGIAALATSGTTAANVVLQASGTGATTSAPHVAAAHEHASDAGDDAAESANESAKPTATAPTCPAGLESHGAYVSSVAKSGKAGHGKDAEHGKPEAPGAHGALVSAAAKSDCGKDAKAEDGDDAGEDKAEAETDDSDETAAPSSTHGQSAQPHGKRTTHPTRQATPTH